MVVSVVLSMGPSTRRRDCIPVLKLRQCKQEGAYRLCNVEVTKRSATESPPTGTNRQGAKNGTCIDEAAHWIAGRRGLATGRGPAAAAAAGRAGPAGRGQGPVPGGRAR